MTRFEIQPAAGVKVQKISSLAKDPRALARGHQRAHRRDHSGQVRGGHRDSQRAPGDRPAQGSARFGAIRLGPIPAFAGARQGHRRYAGDRRHHPHAPPFDRRHHRFRQVGGRQCDAAEHSVQVAAGCRAPDSGRPEDAGTVQLRGHSTPAHPRGHRHETGGPGAELVRGRDGAPLSAHGGARCAQPGGVQPQGAGSGEAQGTDSGSVVGRRGRRSGG